MQSKCAPLSRPTYHANINNAHPFFFFIFYQKMSTKKDTAENSLDKEIIEQQEYADSSDQKRFSQKLSLIFASIALGSDGYQANVIGAVESCLSKIYGSKLLGNGLSTRVSNAMLIGDIVGQVGFGVIIDRLGRKFGILLCTAFVCLVTYCQL